MQRKDIDCIVSKNAQKLNIQMERVEPERGHTVCGNSTIQYSVSAGGQVKQNKHTVWHISVM